MEDHTMRALTLDKVYDCFDNTPVKMEELDRYYVNVDKGRGLTPLKKMKRLFERNPSGSYKFLFAGYKGCGKSTELIRMQRDLQEDFAILNFSVREELDILNLNYIELFIAIMKRLFQFVKEEEKIKIPRDYIDNVTNWINSNEIVEIKDKYMEIGTESGAGVKIGINFLANFFAKFTASAKASSSLKEILKKTVEPKLSELIFHCNALINEIKNKLDKIGKKGLIIIIEDMDKVDLARGEDIFYVHSAQLTQLNCHTIFTFPIALKYYHRFTAIRNNYTHCFDLPMIRVRSKSGRVFNEGARLMKTIIGQRMDPALFETEAIEKKIIQYSGGCLFDMFRMIKDAADNALDFERKVITNDDLDAAYRLLKADYENTIADNREEGISVNRYYEVLVDCARDKNKKPRETKELLDLRNNLTVLGYNGANWSDVHPVVKDILKERGLL
jgi:hypothetical protein